MRRMRLRSPAFGRFTRRERDARERHGRDAITAVETLIGLCWLLLLLAVTGLWGPVGVVGWIALTSTVLAAGHVLYRYWTEAIVELDSAPCKLCGHVGQYNVERQDKRRIWRCACGAEYSVAGPTLHVVDGGSGTCPYLRWKWWGKGRWLPAVPPKST